MSEDPFYSGIEGEAPRQPNICSICDNLYLGMGNNALPINDGRCCNGCNEMVILARLLQAQQSRE